MRKAKKNAAQRIKDTRQVLGMSQAELADSLGISVMTVAAWEQKRQQPPPYLDLALKELIRAHGEKRKATEQAS